MELRERWNELDTGAKLVVGFAVLVVVGLVAVAVTVVLAAVVASFVLGVGADSGGTTGPPTASFTTAHYADNGTLKVTVTSSEPIDAQNLTVAVDGQENDWEDPDGEVTAGDSTIVSVHPDAEVHVYWTDGDSTYTMITRTIESKTTPR